MDEEDITLKTIQWCLNILLIKLQSNWSNSTFDIHIFIKQISFNLGVKNKKYQHKLLVRKELKIHSDEN